MFSKLVCVFFLSLFVYSAQAKPADDHKTSFLKHMSECKLKEGATTEDVTRHTTGLEAITRAGKCIVACLHEAIGLIKDGMAQFGPSIQMGKWTFGNSEKADDHVLGQIHQECAAIEDADRCEAAYKRFICTRTKAEKHGLVPVSP